MLLSQRIESLKKEALKSSNHVVVSRLNQALVAQQKHEQSQPKEEKGDATQDTTTSK